MKGTEKQKHKLIADYEKRKPRKKYRPPSEKRFKLFEKKTESLFSTTSGHSLDHSRP